MKHPPPPPLLEPPEAGADPLLGGGVLVGGGVPAPVSAQGVTTAPTWAHTDVEKALSLPEVS